MAVNIKWKIYSQIKIRNAKNKIQFIYLCMDVDVLRGLWTLQF